MRNAHQHVQRASLSLSVLAALPTIFFMLITYAIVRVLTAITLTPPLSPALNVLMIVLSVITWVTVSVAQVLILEFCPTLLTGAFQFKVTMNQKYKLLLNALLDVWTALHHPYVLHASQGSV